MKLKKCLRAIISHIFPLHKETKAMEMMRKITELEAQNKELAATNERLMKKMNEDMMQVSIKNRKQ